MATWLTVCLAPASLTGEGQAASVPATPSALTVKSYWRFWQEIHPYQYPGNDGKMRFQKMPRYASFCGADSDNLCATPPPPPGWEKADFDDSGWPVERMPFSMGVNFEGNSCGPRACPYAKRFASRGRFVVTDPARVTILRLTVEYTGGVIAYINGVEVGRGGLAAAGEQAEKGYGAPLPALAYLPQTDEQIGFNKRFALWSKPFEIWRWAEEDRSKPEERPRIQKALADLLAARTAVLQVEVPAKALRPGSNVLALDNRTSLGGTLGLDGRGELYFPHIGIHRVILVGDPAVAVTEDAGPKEPQVWVEDPHRLLHLRDHLEAGARARRTLRLCGAAGGTYSGQIAIRAGTSLLNAPWARVDDFAGPDGSRIPAAGVRLRWARSHSAFALLAAHSRGPEFHHIPNVLLDETRSHPDLEVGLVWAKSFRECESLSKAGYSRDSGNFHFDHLSDKSPPAVAERSCQPLWVTVAVPPGAAAGLYISTLTLGAGGLPETKLPVKLQVFQPALPPPGKFVSYVGVEENPWALAKAYGVKLWSPEHWALVEEAIKLAGALGARTVNLPAIRDTSLDNGADTMILWTPKPAGGATAYDYDFSVADRYLDLWRKHCRPDSDVIVHIVLPSDNNGKGGGTGTVNLRNKNDAVEVLTPPQGGTPGGKALWLDFAKSARSHFNGKGIPDRQLHWGQFYDFLGPNTEELGRTLTEAIPEVGWATSRHDPARGLKGWPAKVTWSSCVRGGFSAPFSLGKARRVNGEPPAYDLATYRVESGKGWRADRNGLLVLPRSDTTVTALGLVPNLFQLRSVQEMAISARGSCRGAARFGLDGWGWVGYFGPYVPWLSYPAKPGPEPSAAFEMLREGLQEAEARILIESREPVRAEIQKVLNGRLEREYMLPCYSYCRIAEGLAHGWQERSWDLYAGASAVGGGRAPGQAEKTAFFGDE